MSDPAFTIRWLRRPKKVLHHYSCDKCSTKHSNYVAPDLATVTHMCRYKTKSGTQMKTERPLTLDS